MAKKNKKKMIDHFEKELKNFMSMHIQYNEWNNLFDFIDYLKGKGYSPEQIIDFALDGLLRYDIAFRGL